MIETLLQITGPGFCAGLVARDGRVIEASPIIKKKTRGLTGKQLVALCRKEGWTWIKVHDVVVLERPAPT